MKKAAIILISLAFISIAAYAQIIYCGTDIKQIALTFDDSPSFKYTSKVLDILKKENVKATFFVLGNKVERYPEIFGEIVKGGHEIGNHTFYHSRITSLDNDRMMNELTMTSDIVKKLTGKRTEYFRPPFGSFNIGERKMIENAGYKFVLWSVNADDFYHLGWGMRTPASIVKRVMRGIKGGDIILAHDDSQQLVDALPVIIEDLKNKGYNFVTLSKLSGANNIKMVRKI
jgi:peptidoglycan-N-acetylglucosamine deacetylase